MATLTGDLPPLRDRCEQRSLVRGHVLLLDALTGRSPAASTKPRSDLSNSRHVLADGRRSALKRSNTMLSGGLSSAGVASELHR